MLKKSNIKLCIIVAILFSSILFLSGCGTFEENKTAGAVNAYEKARVEEELQVSIYEEFVNNKKTPTVDSIKEKGISGFGIQTITVDGREAIIAKKDGVEIEITEYLISNSIDKFSSTSAGEENKPVTNSSISINKNVFGYIGKTPKQIENTLGKYANSYPFQGAMWFEYAGYSMAFTGEYTETPEGTVCVIDTNLRYLVDGMTNNVTIQKLDQIFGKNKIDGFEPFDSGDEPEYFVEYTLDNVIVRIVLGEENATASPDAWVRILKAE